MSKPVIGLTGPTGAGKSTVCAVWAKEGCAVVDADRVAREITALPECLAALRAEYGEDIVNSEGALDRELLAARAFATPQKAARLNRITHPLILKEIRDRAARLSLRQPVVLDVPLLFESGADRLCGKTAAVLAPREVRLARIVKRDGISEEQALARMSAQPEDEYYTRRADYVLNGASSPEELVQAAKTVLAQIFGEFHET